MADRYELRLPAVEVKQSPDRVLYTFAVDGKLLQQFATVSRVRRDVNGVRGYQRPEVLSHIASIKHYLECGDPMIPNALVVAFDSRVTFEAIDAFESSPYSRLGFLTIPVDETLDDTDKPGWIVDGQQRCAAIRDADIAEFPICVSAFITDDEADQRAQFILVNSTKPLPKGLVYELLPTTDALLPEALLRRRYSALLLERLNYDEDSPLQYLIRTSTTSEGVSRANSILRMLENSINDGALYRFRDDHSGGGDTERILSLVKNFWSAVREVFAEAWALPPRRSRLMHGVGIVSLGFLMDAIADRQSGG